MNILLTNDDGIDHPGLTYLAKALSKNHRVIIVAPEKQRSACSHNITIHSPVRFKQVANDAYSTDGYTADCVKFSLKGFIKDKIDFVVSGINEGPNMGLDIFYSGTVAGAREAQINNIPSIAFSLNDWGADGAKFIYASEYAAGFVDRLYNGYFKHNEMYNINFPTGKNYKGEKITRLGNRAFKEIVIQRYDPMGKEYYWLGGEMPEHKPEEDSDFTAVENGYISITPLSLDITHYPLYNDLRGKF